mmetsp:Transcript_29161/g.65284  ORF Transcript_29161/g.65284 Transcript_29161/m.65284 type:complete len:309 (+) Transcript_29161:105-1031(+)
MRGLVLALFLAYANAGANVNLNVNHGSILSGPSADRLSGDVSVGLDKATVSLTSGGDVSVESVVSDKLSVGVKMGVSAKPMLRSLAAKITDSIAGHKMKMDLTLDLSNGIDNFAKPPITGTIDAGVIGDASVTAAVNTGNPGWQVVDSLTLTTTSGDWTLSPKIHLDDGCKIDLSASARLSDDLVGKFSVDKAGVGHAALDYNLDADTTVGVTTSGGLEDVEVKVTRKMGADTLTAVASRDTSKSVDLTWVHAMGDQTLTAAVSQLSKVDLTLAAGDWNAKASMPLSDPSAVDIGFGKKLALDSLPGM